jgi:hypothetical protein
MREWRSKMTNRRARTGAREEMSLNKLSAFAASRGEGLHPKLRELLERTAAFPFSEIAVRPDGMLQAGPSPKSETLGSARKMVSLSHERALASVAAETQQLYAGLQMSTDSADTCKSLGHAHATLRSVM